MDISFLQEFMIPVIVAFCLLAGYIVKRWIKDVDNKFIPTICGILGVAMAIWMNFPAITPITIVSGLASGLASTGLHQAFTQFLKKAE